MEREEEKRRAKEEEARRRREEEEKRRREEEEARMRLLMERENFDSMQVEVGMDELSLEDVEFEDHLETAGAGNGSAEDDIGHDDHDDDGNDDDDDDEEEEEEEEDEDYAFPIGPLPQFITNDLKSLDEMVSLAILIKIFWFIENALAYCKNLHSSELFHLVPA